MLYNQNSGYGASFFNALHQIVPTFGRILVVLNSTSDTALPHYNQLKELFSADPDGLVRFYTSLSAAYDAVIDGNNDVILLDAKTSHKLASMLTISKSRVHFIGMDSGDRLQDQRCLISNTGAGAATDTAMVKVTGTGCTFRNIKFANNWTHANNLYCVDDQASNTLFKNCTIQNLGSAHLTNANAASLRLSSDTSKYKECTLGQDTLKITSTAGQVVLVKKATTAAKRVVFKDCQFLTYTSDTTHVFVRVSADGDIDRSVTFVNPIFENFNYDASNGGAQLAVCIATPANLVSGGIHVVNPAFLFATKLATAAVGNAGVYVSANVQPTAAGVAAIKATA